MISVMGDGVEVLTVKEPPQIDGLSAPQANFRHKFGPILSSFVTPQIGKLPALSIGQVVLHWSHGYSPPFINVFKRSIFSNNWVWLDPETKMIAKKRKAVIFIFKVF